MTDEPTGAAASASDLGGRDWRLLWSSYGAANLADGILLAAGPLLVTTLTRDPFLVALATAVQLAPTFLFSLLVGAVVDRADRRRLQWVAHAVRAVVLVVLVTAIAGGSLGLPLVYTVLFALGTAEVVADTAGETLVAAIVPHAALGTANSRLIGTSSVLNRLAGPPLGAFLLGVGLAVPFATNAVLLVAAAVLVARIGTTGRPAAADPGAAAVDQGAVRRLRREIAEGWRFTMATPPVRRLALLITAFNLTFGAVFGIQVLWALERLGLDEVGFGALLSASAVGGAIGSALFPTFERRFSYATMLRAGLVLESATHFAFAATTAPLVAGAIFVLFGVHEAVWGSLAGTIRLKVVPAEVLGRVNSVYRLAVIGPLLVGAGLGGVLADAFGILAPFLYAGVGASLTTVLVWRSMSDLGSAAETSTVE